ncbi:MAG: hypothetical protein O3C57_01065, partial [Verrucomicrobia bacterium]|nr:hypothetical protein [Verrucomicrobiota bacterium]
ETLDSDLDSLPDWWELFYSSSIAMVANVDNDNDGFSNLSEYRDGADPSDPLSRPSPPAIAHTPLGNPQRQPAAWPVFAQVTDSTGVQDVMLEWRRNNNAWQQAAMTAGSNDLYSGAIPMPGASGDTFSYYIRAADKSGLQSINGTYTFSVAYPIMSLSTQDFGIISLSTGETAFRVLGVQNLGHEALQWTADLLSRGMRENVENGTNNWTHSGANDVWHISNFRSYSGSNSWYFGSDLSRRYPDSAKASLTSPPIHIPPQAAFSFMQWLHTEELQDPQHAWDAAIVEISTNAGLSFTQIAPVGGYPYRMFGHPASPFANETPCLAGTGGWERITFDLAAFAGHFAQLRLQFGSDGFVTEEGWYVDDLEVTPYGGNERWLTATTTNASVASQSTKNMLLVIDAQGFDYGERRQSVIRLTSNDPVTPMQFVSIGAVSTSRRIEVLITGPGRVTPPGPIEVNVGDNINFLIEADTYHHIANILTGQNVVEQSLNLARTNFQWTSINVASTGQLHVVFAANIVTNSLTELWLASHGLTNQAFLLEALSDYDGDGASAWQEFIAGTDPTNRADVLALYLQDANAVSNAPPSEHVQRLRLTWPSAPERTYRLFQANDMASDFSVVVSNITATPPLNVYTSNAPLLTNAYFLIEARFGE